MSRSPDRLVRMALLAAPLAVAFTLTSGSPAVAQADTFGVIQDIIYRVESLDGTELVEREDAQVVVTLTSDVLFDLDEYELTSAARKRLVAVAEQIRLDGASGVITIAGHTDDQGSDSYNQGLSERRAEAVRDELAKLLASEDVTFKTVGHGESRPRVPNIVGGGPNEENRAQNRRVEITYDVRD